MLFLNYLFRYVSPVFYVMLFNVFDVSFAILNVVWRTGYVDIKDPRTHVPTDRKDTANLTVSGHGLMGRPTYDTRFRNIRVPT